MPVTLPCQISTNNRIQWKMQPLSCQIHSQNCLVVLSDHCIAAVTSDKRLSVTGCRKSEPISVILLTSRKCSILLAPPTYKERDKPGKSFVSLLCTQATCSAYANEVETVKGTGHFAQ